MGFESLTNPIHFIKLPKLPQGRTRRLDDKELISLLDALDETIEVKTICLLAIETGMRRSEILKIEWEHIYLDNRFLLLPDTKNGEPRTIPLSSRALAILEGIKVQSGKLFSTKPQSVSQAFNRACKRANLDNLRFHDLRHEATSRFFELGLNTIVKQR
jgi:integrase